jgi:UDP-3-O-[3-hydroxymyristoyl] glucosamine N-acyltransferase
MNKPLHPLRASDVARAVAGELVGDDAEIVCASPSNRLVAGALTFAGGDKVEIHPNAEAVVLVHRGKSRRDGNVYVEVDNPRLAFATALHAFFAAPVVAGTASSARILAGAAVDPTVAIGEHVVIESGCVIGARTVIQHGAIIQSGSRIGSDCVVAAGAVIGAPGFGYERDAHGVPHHIPHLGGVTLGDRVHVGANSTIGRGTLTDTIIGDDTKIGGQVNVQHNVVIGRRVIIASQAQISGSAVVGDDCWLGPNCTIRGVTIGERATVGLGALVLSDLAAGASVMGAAALVAGIRAEAKYAEPKVLTPGAVISEFDRKFESLVRSVFKLPPAFAITDALTARDVPGWDSVSNINLLLDAQESFGVPLAIEEMAEFRSLGDLRRALLKRISGHVL